MYGEKTWRIRERKEEGSGKEGGEERMGVYVWGVRGRTKVFEGGGGKREQEGKGKRSMSGEQTDGRRGKRRRNPLTEQVWQAAPPTHTTVPA